MALSAGAVIGMIVGIACCICCIIALTQCTNYLNCFLSFEFFGYFFEVVLKVVGALVGYGWAWG